MENPKVPVKTLVKNTQCNLVTNDTGNWKLMTFRSKTQFGIDDFHKVLYKPKQNPGDTSVDFLVRIHSECYTGDVFNSAHCDCGAQLKSAMKMMHHNGCGLIILPSGHEGRGIGFENKVRCYHLMQNDPSLDTYSANVALGFPEDLRDYRDCKKILEFIGINDFVLLTSNPKKIAALGGLRFSVCTEIVPDSVNETNKKYIKTKLKKHIGDEENVPCLRWWLVQKQRTC